MPANPATPRAATVQTVALTFVSPAALVGYALNQDVIKFFRRVAVFSSLPDDYMKFLAERAGRKNVASGEYIYQVGMPAEAMFIIARGEAVELNEDPALQLATELRRYGPGEVLGLTAMLGGVDRSCSAKAVDQCSLFVVDQRIIFGFMQRLPKYAVDLCRHLAVKLDKAAAEKVPAAATAGGQKAATNIVYDEEIYNMIPRRLVEQYRVIPFKLENEVLTVATPDPGNIMALDDIRRCLHGVRVEPVFINDADYRRFLSKNFGDTGSSTALNPLMRGGQMSSAGTRATSGRRRAVDPRMISYLTEELEKKETVGGDPVITFDEIVAEALELGTSDIHIEPAKEGVQVRFRVDGALRLRKKPVARGMHKSLVARIKILANLDISETRAPQDGRISFTVGEGLYDMRVSTMPTIIGEKAVLRVLDATKATRPLNEVVTYERACNLMRKMVHQPFGAIIACGPTGSGKTTTLYAMLHERREVQTNITTVEDPVEYHVPGINQIQVNEAFRLGFATVLRGCLRQNPDILLVGETRDALTAKISLEAGLTGHLVLTSLHANTAAGALIRLLEMDMDPFTIGHAVNCIISQRLVREICASCRARHTYRPAIADLLVKAGFFPRGFDGALYRGKGCDFCAGTGLRGRTAVYEILTMNEAMREQLGQGVTIDALTAVARKGGHISMEQYAQHLLHTGQTTPEEVLRIAGSRD